MSFPIFQNFRFLLVAFFLSLAATGAVIPSCPERVALEAQFPARRGDTHLTSRNGWSLSNAVDAQPEQSDWKFEHYRCTDGSMCIRERVTGAQLSLRGDQILVALPGIGAATKAHTFALPFPETLLEGAPGFWGAFIGRKNPAYPDRFRAWFIEQVLPVHYRRSLIAAVKTKPAQEARWRFSVEPDCGQGLCVREQVTSAILMQRGNELEIAFPLVEGETDPYRFTVAFPQILNANSPLVFVSVPGRRELEHQDPLQTWFTTHFLAVHEDLEMARLRRAAKHGELSWEQFQIFVKSGKEFRVRLRGMTKTLVFAPQDTVDSGRTVLELYCRVEGLKGAKNWVAAVAGAYLDFERPGTATPDEEAPYAFTTDSAIHGDASSIAETLGLNAPTGDPNMQPAAINQESELAWLLHLPASEGDHAMVVAPFHSAFDWKAEDLGVKEWMKLISALLRHGDLRIARSSAVSTP